MAINFETITNQLKELIVQSLSKSGDDITLTKVRNIRKSISIFENINIKDKTSLSSDKILDLETLFRNLRQGAQTNEVREAIIMLEKAFDFLGLKVPSDPVPVSDSKISREQTITSTLLQSNKNNPKPILLPLTLPATTFEEEPEINFHLDSPIAENAPLIPTNQNKKEVDLVTIEASTFQQHLTIVAELASVSSALENAQKTLKAHQQTLEKLKTVAHTDLSAVSGKEKEIKGLIERETERQTALLETDYILKDDALRDYYYVFRITFNDVLLACKAIHSGMIDENDRTVGDIAVKIVERIGHKIPVAGIVADIFTGAFRAATYRDKQAAVNRAATFIADAKICAEIAEILARRLTLSQMNELRQLSSQTHKGLKAKLHKVEQFLDKLFVNDVDTKIKKLSDKQCRVLLTAIMKGKVSPHPEVKDIDNLISIILDKHFIYQSPLIESSALHRKETDATINSATSATSSNSMSDLEILSGTTETAHLSHAKLPVQLTRSVTSNIRDMKRVIDEQQAQIKAQEQQQRELQNRLQQQALEADNNARMRRELEEIKRKMEMMSSLTVTGNGNQAQSQAVPTDPGMAAIGVSATMLVEYNQRIMRVENGLQILEESKDASSKNKEEGKKDHKTSLIKRIFRKKKHKAKGVTTVATAN